MPKKKMGRPRKEIDWVQFDKLCEIQCTEEEIADWFRVSVDTIERACKRDKKATFAEYSRQKRAVGKRSLRRVMWNKATKGNNPALLIWLSKNYLGMADKIEQKNTDTVTVKDESKLKGMETKEIAHEYKKHMSRKK
jgi:hypothetical protein